MDEQEVATFRVERQDQLTVRQAIEYIEGKARQRGYRLTVPRRVTLAEEGRGWRATASIEPQPVTRAEGG